MKPIKHRLHRRRCEEAKGRRSNLKKITQIIFIFFLLLPLTNYRLLITDVYAEIPKLINYQAQLTDSQGKPITETIKIVFRLYDASSGGTLLWESIYDPSLQGSRGVTIDSGIFNERLGEFNNGNGQFRNLADLPFDKRYWLGIQVGSDTEMRPLQPLTSSAYALRANERAQSQTYTLINLRISSERNIDD